MVRTSSLQMHKRAQTNKQYTFRQHSTGRIFTGRSTQPGHPSIGRRNEYQRTSAINRHILQRISLISVVTSQCKLVSSWRLKKQRLAHSMDFMTWEGFYTNVFICATHRQKKWKISNGNTSYSTVWVKVGVLAVLWAIKHPNVLWQFLYVFRKQWLHIFAQ